MRPQLQAVAARNGGVVTRHDALAAGYLERELRTLTSHFGAWVVVRRGCYVEREVWDWLDVDRRYALQVRAALLVVGGGAVPSHGSAAVLLGMPMRPHWRELVHLTRTGVTGSRTEGGIKHHRAGFDETDLTVARGISCTGLARTAIDVAREHGFEDGVVASDAALRLGTTRADLGQALQRMPTWPHVSFAHAAVAVADGGAETIGESLLRLMVLELDIGVPETQYVVREGSRWASADLRVGRHLFEFDGRIKYVGRALGGVADRPAHEVLWDEKQREDWLRRAGGGHGVSRVVWQEMLGAERRRTLRRLWNEYQATVARFGSQTG